jgi:hypothetical protein
MHTIPWVNPRIYQHPVRISVTPSAALYKSPPLLPVSLGFWYSMSFASHPVFGWHSKMILVLPFVWKLPTLSSEQLERFGSQDKKVHKNWHGDLWATLVEPLSPVSFDIFLLYLSSVCLSSSGRLGVERDPGQGIKAPQSALGVSISPVWSWVISPTC